MEEYTTMDPNSTQRVQESEGQTSSMTATLAAGTSVLQSFKPMGGICEAFCGIHLYPDNPKRQYIGYHYCHMIDEDRRQCLVYDSDSENAKLVAVEYIISEKLFKELSDTEKKYWHSHKYEVESGLVVQIAKGMVPDMVTKTAELPALKVLVNTYGKTIQLWPVDDKHECSSLVPEGPPQLVVSFTRDDQVDVSLLAKRDKDLGISTFDRRAEREGKIQGNPVVEGADQWTKGKPWQIHDCGEKGECCKK